MKKIKRFCEECEDYHTFYEISEDELNKLIETINEIESKLYNSLLQENY